MSDGTLHLFDFVSRYKSGFGKILNGTRIYQNDTLDTRLKVWGLIWHILKFRDSFGHKIKSLETTHI